MKRRKEVALRDVVSFSGETAFFTFRETLERVKTSQPGLKNTIPVIFLVLEEN